MKLERNKFKVLLDELIYTGEEILRIEITNENFADIQKEYDDWNDYNIEFLKRSFNHQKNEYRYSYEKTGLYNNFFNPDFKRNKIFEFKELFMDKINNLQRLLKKVDLIESEANNVSQANSRLISLNKKDIFIVHGQDDATKFEVARFIEKLELNPIILHEQASSGTTIIEKIEKYTDVGFSVVLYTACDVGAKKGNETNLNNRARQNVVFEHGYLIAKIGRNNVAALVKGEIEKPNDISGVVYISMSDQWKLQLAKELLNSGYQIDMNNVIK